MWNDPASSPAADNFAGAALVCDLRIRSKITERERGTSPAIKAQAGRRGGFKEGFVDRHIERGGSWLAVFVDMQLVEDAHHFGALARDLRQQALDGRARVRIAGDWSSHDQIIGAAFQR